MTTVWIFVIFIFLVFGYGISSYMYAQSMKEDVIVAYATPDDDEEETNNKEGEDGKSV